jgi:putative hydrolase of HD superfamily
MKIESLLPFLKEIDHLKSVERQTLNHNGGRRENTAEHSWHLAMAVIIFQSFSKEKIDLARALKMALIHDLVEIDAGDTFIYGDVSNKKAAETAAIERITNLLPEDLDFGLKRDLKELWLEFEDRRSPEAQYVAALDKFLPLFSNHLNAGYSWKQHQVSADKVYANIKNPAEEAIPQLWELAQQLLTESIKSGHLIP